MYTAELFIGRMSKAAPPSDAAEAIDSLCSALQRNGQLLPDIVHQVAATKRGYRVFVSLPERTALRRSLYNDNVRDALKRLSDLRLSLPSVRILGQAPDSALVCRCPSWKWLYMTTNYLTCELPLRCGACAGVVPFYRFSHTSNCGTYEDIIFWQHAYRHYDAIWMTCRAGEMLAYRELSRHDSYLTEQGLSICKRIEMRTRTPVYYYLMRHTGRSKPIELRRKCPSCKRAWHLPAPLHRIFDFQCNDCRLLSNIAFEVA